MRIKTKLKLGIGFLFILIILLAFFSIEQINSLSSASENIIKDNKETIAFTRNMLKALSEIDKNEEALDMFESYLIKQKSNITEIGEEELTEKLSANFQLLKENANNKIALANAQSFLFEIMNINLKAIELKNNIAAETAKRSILLISILSSFCFIIALILFVKLPGNISNPIKELIKSIKHIAANDYSQRVDFEGHSELGELATSFNTMANKLDEFNKSNIAKLLAEKKITETLLNKIHYPIIGFDEHMIVTLINEEFLKISGLNNKEIIGTPILEIASENDLIRQLIIMDPVKEHKLSTEETNLKIHIDRQGKDIYFEKEIQEIAYTTINQEEKHLLGYVIILKNITKFVDLDLAKTNFIATVSHELKTPISAIKFSLELLKNAKTGMLNDEQLDLIMSCEEDTDRLLKIISELLNITQIETGNIQLNIMPSYLKDILQYAINTNKFLADQKNISFDIVCPENLPEVLADKEKTAWVITNLISNAIRYSNKNSQIVISISNNGKQQMVSVKDNGQGIDIRYKDKIFDRYFRVPGTNKEGTGLGLAISKEFIEAQGGQISVDSELGIGSTFAILLNNLNSI
ncbi:MAG: PAS domain-containing sensor histidine kinase [Bacteroidetes bacterium HGW-Bacteroidetes-17]|jgi:PAS domain S-box-containing protein|nr:MAG: PAS domain-containing sensor histidine kinase [Bacteroidetes bacterium HGW-Bacteroidetes-17]